MFKNYFDFSRKELSGILVLGIIIVLLFGIDVLLEKCSKPPQYDYSEYLKDLEYFTIDSDSVKPNDTKFDARKFQKTEIIFIDSCFNPNSVDSIWLISKGFSPKLTRSFLKYRSVLKGFKTKQNIRDVYGMSDETFKAIESFICFSESEQIPNFTAYDKKASQEKINSSNKLDVEKETPMVKRFESKPIPKDIIDINSADSAALKQLPGIGESFAQRIIKYRNIVGGYISKNQLLEVYGFTPEMLEKISPYIEIGNRGIVKINVNKKTVKSLQSHPYINFYQAKAIVEFRQKVKLISNFEQLYSIPEIDTTNFAKLKHYLVFD